ncbi:trypsin-like peptidase [Kribbella sp. VKM Ac-2571]|uniref:NACHT domain-containing protein n=1 Tax=Kribbella sp. VKM Ac-2571 TaxID=2512222 RepID=UPI0010E4B523|nr:trypsin-like peptidase domain-containing protein [Kribbella sp. VKM Ac-2571]TDO45615.1 trypsin-like peptidase [Kribbella sp. VKM Ac-2571]
MLIRYTRDGLRRRGSGLRIAADLVLTADHCADGTDHQLVFGGTQHAAEVVVRSRTETVDVAILRGIGLPQVEPMQVALVNGSVAARMDTCQALGFPVWKDRQDDQPPARRRPTLAQCDGYVPTAEGHDPGRPVGAAPLLTFKMTGPAVQQIITTTGELDRSASQWAGMSGAAVIADSSSVIGVIRSHNLAEGGMSLSMTSLQSIRDLPPDVAAEFWKALHVTDPVPWLPASSEAARPSSQLDDYLRAAEKAAQSHPYFGPLSRGPLPPLRAVYLRQFVSRGAHGNADDSLLDVSGLSLVLATEVFKSPETSVVLAGPGGGKSSLLRSMLAEAVGNVRSGLKVPALPVIVSAADLAGLVTDTRPEGQPRLTLPAAIAAAATEQLVMFGLQEELSPSLFRRRPLSGVPWLVLIDGLDEILDAYVRLQLLTTLRSNISGSMHSYRLVVTTRPLPFHELDTLGPDHSRFQLAGFDPDDLSAFAERWFRAVGSADPERAAAHFLRLIADRKLTDLASTPLVATMLCQLHSEAPDSPLPRSRGAIYREFIDMLQDRAQAGGSGSRLQARASLRRYGDRTVARADRTLDHLHDLVRHIAAAEYGGDRRHTMDIVATHPEAAVPQGMPHSAWIAFLGSALRSSGLLVSHADGYTFAHHTLLEFFAAEAAVRETAVPLRQYVDGERSTPSPDAESYVGFVLDELMFAGGAGAEAACTFLELLASDRGFRGSRFVAVQLQLGTQVPPAATQSAVETLAAIARDDNPGAERAAAIDTLADIGVPRAGEVLEDLACDASRPAYQRIHAAAALAATARLRGLQLLDTMARDPALHGGSRLRAASRLAALGDARGAARLEELTTHALLGDHVRVQSAEQLVSIGDARGVASLDRLALNPDVGVEGRIRAAELLARHGDSLGSGLLHEATATGYLNRSYQRARRKDSTGFSVLEAIARDGRIDGALRFKAAMRLAAFEDLSTDRVFVHLARDSGLAPEYRMQAADHLISMGSPNGFQVLFELAHGRKLDRELRTNAAMLLQLHGWRPGRRP